MSKIWFVAVSLFVSQIVHAAAEFQYFVFPVRGLTGISQSALGHKGTGPKYGGMINEKYADQFFTPDVQQRINASFIEEVRKAFPTSAVGANQIGSSRSGKYAYEPFDAVQCSPKFQVGYKDAFGIAVGVSRLSLYINTYGNYVDALIPVTYTVRFVQLNGANLVFARSETIYTRYTALASEFFAPGTRDMAPAVSAKLQGAIMADGLSSIRRLVDSAAKGFSPKQSQITVVGRDGDYILLSHGSEVGFSSDEAFDAINEKGVEMSYDIVYATNGIAVAIASDFTPEVKRLSNAVRTGDKLNFIFTKQGKDDAKPTVLATQYLSQYMPEGRLTERQIQVNALTSLIADDIGFKAPFNIVKQDADFVFLKNQIRADVACENIFRDLPGFADNSTQPRKLPDYFLKLDMFSSPAHTSWGVGRVNSSTVFDNSVSLSLVDRSNVINQAFIGNSPYVLERNAGKGLAFSEAQEVNLKNASLVALQSMVSGFSNRPKVVAIKNVSASTVTLEQPLSVMAFEQARLVRSLQSNNKQILMPLPGDVAKLIKPTQDTDRIEIKGQLRPSDLVQIGGIDFLHKPLMRCEGRQTRFLTVPLNKPSSGEEVIANHVMAKAKGFNLIETDAVFLRAVGYALRDGYFEPFEISAKPSASHCYAAVELQQLQNNACAADKCTGTATVASGMRLYEGANKVGESIVGGRFDYSEIHPDALSNFVGVKAYENHIKSVIEHKSKLN
jgi:hypothetical protein